MKSLLVKSAATLFCSVNFIQAMEIQDATQRWQIVRMNLTAWAIELSSSTQEQKNIYFSSFKLLDGLNLATLQRASQALLSDYHDTIETAISLKAPQADKKKSQSVFEFNRIKLVELIEGDLGDLIESNLEEAVNAVRRTPTLQPFIQGPLFLLIGAPAVDQNITLATFDQIALVKVIQTLLLHARNEENIVGTVIFFTEELIKKAQELQESGLGVPRPCFVQ